MAQGNFYNLEIYKIARQLSSVAWIAYISMNWNTKKTIGNQFIESIDSIGANIAESCGRYHYLDKIKFLYNSRGSYYEAILHWTELLYERGLIEERHYTQIIAQSNIFIPKLNSYINSLYKSKQLDNKPAHN